MKVLGHVALALSSTLGCQTVLGLDEGQLDECVGGVCCPAPVASCEGACGTVIDSCGRSLDCGGCPLWSKSFGDGSDQSSVSLSSFNADIQAEHVTIITGAFLGEIGFGDPDNAVHSTDADPGIFFSAFSSAGVPMWSSDVHGEGFHRVVGVTMAQFGPRTYAYTAGNFSSYLHLGGKTLSADPFGDIFVAQYDAWTGEYLRSVRYGEPESVQRDSQGVSTISSGVDGVFFTGNFSRGLSIGSTTLEGGNTYVARLDHSLEARWARLLSKGVTNNVLAERVVAHPLGGVLLVGRFAPTVDLANGDSESTCSPLSSAGGTDVFVAKLDSAGVCTWSISFGSVASEDGVQAAVDADGSVLFSLGFEGEIRVGSSVHRSEGASDDLIVKLDAEGHPLWSKRIGSASGERVVAITTDVDKSVIALGYFVGTIELGGGPLVSAGKRDIFVLKLDPEGRYLWSRRIGGPGDDVSVAVGIDYDGSISLTGSFGETLDFKDPSGPHMSLGGQDVFLAKISR